MEYELQPFEPNERDLFYRLDGKSAKRHGAIGYMRADFGRNGNDFYTTWFDNQRHLKSSTFKAEFDKVINYLRLGIFADRVTMKTFCSENSAVSLGERGTGFKLNCAGYSYYLRCNPGQSDYDAYIFAYDNRYLLPELAGQHELPNYCYAVMPHSGEMVRVVRGENGYHKCECAGLSFDTIRFKVNDENQLRHITRAQEEAMLAGSLFGWDTPAAKPWNYNQDGTRRQTQPKKSDPERG